jgi:hypothetical protein
MNVDQFSPVIQAWCRVAIFSLLGFCLSACGGSGGAGLSPLAPGAYGGQSTPAPTATPSPTPTLAPGAITFGTPTFNPSNDGAQDCGAANGVSILAINAIATIPISQANHSGAYTVSVSDSTIISASVSGSALSVTALATGTATATVRDDAGHAATCAIGVTTANGTVQ